MGTGKPIRTDLSLVGQGTPSLVLAYENFSPSGGEALNRLRRVQAHFETRLVILAADLGTPAGRQFADQHEIIDGQTVFMNQAGQSIEVSYVAANESELRATLETYLSRVE